MDDFAAEHERESEYRNTIVADRCHGVWGKAIVSVGLWREFPARISERAGPALCIGFVEWGIPFYELWSGGKITDRFSADPAAMEGLDVDGSDDDIVADSRWTTDGEACAQFLGVPGVAVRAYMDSAAIRWSFLELLEEARVPCVRGMIQRTHEHVAIYK